MCEVSTFDFLWISGNDLVIRRLWYKDTIINTEYSVIKTETVIKDVIE